MPICVGCGLELQDGILQVDVDGITITCGPNGLQAGAVSSPSSLTIGTNDCESDHQLLANAESGVQALHTKSLAGIDGDALVGFDGGTFLNLVGPVPPDTENTYILHPNGVYLDVAHDECAAQSVHGTVEYVVGGVQFVTIGPAYIMATIQITQQEAPTVSFGTGVPGDRWIMDARLNTGVQEQVWSLGSMADRTWNVIDPGGTKRFGAQIYIQIMEGNGRVEDIGAAWEIAYHFSHK